MIMERNNKEKIKRLRQSKHIRKIQRILDEKWIQQQKSLVNNKEDTPDLTQIEGNNDQSKV